MERALLHGRDRGKSTPDSGGEGVGRGLCAEGGLSGFFSCSIGDPDERAEGLIHGVRVRKFLGDIWRQHDHIASGCIALGVLSPDALAEIIFRQHAHVLFTLLHR